MATRKNVSLAALLEVVMDKEVADAEVGRDRLNLTLQSFRGRLKSAMQDHVESFIGYESDMQRFLGKPKVNVDQLMADIQDVSLEEFREKRSTAISTQADEEKLTVDQIAQRYIERQSSNDLKSQERKDKARTAAKKNGDGPPAKRGRPKLKKERASS